MLLGCDNVRLSTVLDEKNLETPPLKPDQYHDLDRWSEDKVVIKRRTPRNKHPEKSTYIATGTIFKIQKLCY